MPTGSSRSPSCPTRARPTRRCATTPRVLATASTSPIRGLCSPSPRAKDVVATRWPSTSWGANPDATLTAQKRLSGKVNYLAGDDPAKWQQGLPTHGELLYGGLWPGIDMAVRGEGGKLKYEFHLKPGSSVEDVQLAYRGAEGLKVGTGGELLVQTPLGILKDAAPVSYQRIGDERVPVESRYTLREDGGYGFAVGAYDPRYPLVIDPELDYSTFLGGTDTDFGLGIAVDGSGSAYVTGQTYSTNYPTTQGAFDTTFNGGAGGSNSICTFFGQECDAFVTK